MVSDEQLISDLQEFAEELGEKPTTVQMQKDGPWSATVYISHFGSWDEALIRSGFEEGTDHSFKSKPDSKQELLQDLKQFADEIGETPTAKQMNDDGPWSAKTYRKYFETWNRALNKAGIGVKRSFEEKKKTSKKELIEDMKEFVDELGRSPKVIEMRQKGPWSAMTYIKYFGSWSNAVRQAGFEPVRDYSVEGEWRDDVDNYYGESWPEVREKVVQRDDGLCRVCGDDELIHVHHIKPRRCFEDPDNSNTLDNLITLCISCHGRYEGRWTATDPDEFEAKARELLSVA